MLLQLLVGWAVTHVCLIIQAYIIVIAAQTTHVPHVFPSACWSTSFPPDAAAMSLKLAQFHTLSQLLTHLRENYPRCRGCQTLVAQSTRSCVHLISCACGVYSCGFLVGTQRAAEPDPINWMSLLTVVLKSREELGFLFLLIWSFGMTHSSARNLNAVVKCPRFYKKLFSSQNNISLIYITIISWLFLIEPDIHDHGGCFLT